MNGLLLLHGAPGAGSDAPFEMLVSCHERVERTLQLLERLADHLARHGADAQARDAARDVLRYFDVAAPHHHEDEQLHVLPTLRALGHDALADRVQAEHAQMAAAWAALRVQLQAVQVGDAARALAPPSQDQWRAFARLYRQHIALEDDVVFPLARAALDAAAQQSMGDEMARRRGLIIDPTS